MSELNKLLGDITENQEIGTIACMIQGQAKMGKSTLALSASEIENTLVLNFENGLAFFKESENLRIFPSKSKTCNMSNLAELYKALKISEHNFKTVVFDTADGFVEIIINWHLQNEGIKKMRIQDYVPVYNKFMDTIKAFRNLGLNVILTSHVKKDDDLGKLVAALPGKLVSTLGGYLDFIFHLTADNSGQRVLYTKPNGLYDAGDRQGKLPETLINAKWKDIIDIVKDDEDPYAKYAEMETKTVAKSKKD